MNELSSVTAAGGYAAARDATRPTAEAGLASVAEGFAAVVQQGEKAAVAAMTGGGDSQAMVEALARTQLAVEGVTAIRDRVIEAYQEILRMPV